MEASFFSAEPLPPPPSSTEHTTLTKAETILLPLFAMQLHVKTFSAFEAQKTDLTHNLDLLIKCWSFCGGRWEVFGNFVKIVAERLGGAGACGVLLYSEKGKEKGECLAERILTTQALADVGSIVGMLCDVVGKGVGLKEACVW